MIHIFKIGGLFTLGRLGTVGETNSNRLGSLRQPEIMFFLGYSLEKSGSAAIR